MFELVKRFFEETKFDTNDNILAVVVYGSRVTNTATKNSDLDVFVLTNYPQNYKMARLIDGVRIDINMVSLPLIQRDEYEVLNNYNYYKSLITTGVIEKEKFNSLDIIRELTEIKPKKDSKANYNSLFNWLNRYYNCPEEEMNYCYLNVLEQIRRVYYKEHRLSKLSIKKTYDSFINRKKYKEIYKLDLPEEYFVSAFTEAIQSSNQEKYIQQLLSYLKELPKYIHESYREEFYMNGKELEIKIINLYHKTIDVMDMMLADSKYKDIAYYNLLGQLEEMYIVLKKTLPGIFEIGKTTTNTEMKISILETLLYTVANDFELDFDDYKKVSF